MPFLLIGWCIICLSGRFTGLACENIRFSSFFAAADKDEERGETDVFAGYYRSSSLRISGNCYFEAVLLYFAVPLSRILEPMCYCQNHYVLPLVIIPLIALFDVMGLESFIFILDVTFFVSPWTAYVVNYQSRLSCFPSYACLLSFVDLEDGPCLDWCSHL